MMQEAQLVIEALGAAFVRGPEGPELYALLSLAGIALSLCLMVVFYRRRRSMLKAHSGNVQEESVQSTQEIAAAQAELRALVQGFSTLAAQVLQALECDHEGKSPTDPRSRIRTLVETGLNSTEIARATGLTIGEVALMMNLQKVRPGTDCPTTPSSDGRSVSEPVHGGNGKADLR